MTRYCFIRGHPVKALENAIEDLDDVATTPGDLMWVPCPCERRHPCEACQDTGMVLTTVPKGGEDKRCL